MNIYVLDEDPKAAAIAQCDAHVVQGILEGSQLLVGVAYDLKYDITLPIRYRANAGLLREWLAQDRPHRLWLSTYLDALFKEYTYRYRREHRLEERMQDMLAGFMDSHALPHAHCRFVACTPAGYWPVDPIEDTVDVVAAYRRYYMMEKRRIARYTRRKPPPWMAAALEQPPTLPVMAPFRASPYIGIPVKIEARQVQVSLFDPHTFGMPAVGDKPLVVRFDGTCRTSKYCLGSGATRALKELRNHATHS